MSKECPIRSWGNGESNWLCAQSCPALCDPLSYRPPGSSCVGFPRQEYWSGLSFPSLGNATEVCLKARVSLQ